MAEPDLKADLLRYLQDAREALLWKLDGLSEYDVRRPLVPSGTNLLGLVKHLAAIEVGYLGDTFARPCPDQLPWDESDPNGDMVAAPEESRELIVSLYRRAWAHAAATLDALPLDAIGHVPWWPAGRNEVTLHHVLARVTAETNRHAGHADIIRELIDGAIGLTAGRPNVPEAEDDQAWWSSHHDRVEDAARQAANGSSGLAVTRTPAAERPPAGPGVAVSRLSGAWPGTSRWPRRSPAPAIGSWGVPVRAMRAAKSQVSDTGWVRYPDRGSNRP
jgi:hypothetical protein